MIQTIKIESIFYTFEDTHDDPKSTERFYAFPNEWVGTGNTSEKSKLDYKQVQKEIEAFRAWAKWFQIYSIEGDYEAFQKTQKVCKI